MWSTVDHVTLSASPYRLAECLRDFGPCDWQLAGLVCQTLWNCTEDGMDNVTEELLHTLSIYLGVQVHTQIHILMNTHKREI